MLDFVYYPVSFILWCWHVAFGFVLGDADAVGWTLAIVFLVFTLRAILLKPALGQIRFQWRMRQVAPEMRALQERHAGDRDRQTTELQKLFLEHKVSPLSGYLPMLLQIPVFIGLNHVLRSFTLSPHGSNYFFSAADVHSYLAAKLFGAHLGDAILNTQLWGGGAHHALWLWQVAPVAIPLIIVAAVATHVTARLSLSRQLTTGGAGTIQAATIGKITSYLVPLVVLVFGAALPVGLLVYWVSNNVWTLAQQHLAYGRIDREMAGT